MKEIAIYVEGGGVTAQQNAELRNGFDALLDNQKQAARQKRIRWKLVPCGGRDMAYQAFIARFQEDDPDVLPILLVDSEDAVPPERPTPKNETPEAAEQRELADAEDRKNHLLNREAHWDELADVPAPQIHLMARCSEAWIAADPDAVADFYGKGFLPKRMPNTNNLEGQSRHDLFDKLCKASEKTKKGAYEKIKHASKLLALIDPAKVADLCPRFETFTTWLDKQIAEA